MRIRRVPDDESDNRQVIGGWKKRFAPLEANWIYLAEDCI